MDDPRVGQPNGEMMDRPVVISKEIERKELERIWGGYNDPPPNFQPCDPNEFWRAIQLYGFGDMMDFRQIHMEKYKPLLSVHLFWHGDHGYGISVEQKSVPTTNGPTYSFQTTETPSFWKFYLCDHIWQHTRTLGRCWNEYKCTKCGKLQEIDSSD